MLTNKYLAKYYFKYIYLYIIGIIALIVVDIVQTYIPDILGKITDLFDTASKTGFTPEMNKDIINLALYSLYIGIAMFLGRIFWRLTIFNASQKTEAGLRHRMFLKAEELSCNFYHKNTVGNVMALFTTDLETIEEYLGWGLIMLVDAIILTGFTLFKMFRASWQLTLIALLPMILIVVWGFLVEIFISKKWEQKQASFDKLYDYTQENFTGIKVIKAFVKENQEIRAFSKLARENQEINVSFGRMSIIFDVLIQLIITAIVSLIMGVGAFFVYKEVKNETIILFGSPITIKTSGDYVQYISLFDILIWPLIALGQVISMRSRAKASLKRISKFLNSDVDVKSPKNAIKLENIKGKITFKDLNFSYQEDNKTDILKHISFEIMPGEKIGIVGKIGSGKSTIASLLLRLYNFPEDSIFIDDIDLMNADITSVRNNVSYVPQDNFLFSDSVRNNIAFSNKELPNENVLEAAEFANVHNDIVQFENQYETVSGERGVTLSGGQKQRISIARAYIKNAPIMILDDSVSAVDIKTEETIIKNIKEKCPDKTVIIIASRVSTVSNLDKILVLKNGEVEAFGPHHEIINSSKTYQKMVELQKLEEELEGK